MKRQNLTLISAALVIKLMARVSVSLSKKVWKWVRRDSAQLSGNAIGVKEGQFRRIWQTSDRRSPIIDFYNGVPAAQK